MLPGIENKEQPQEPERPVGGPWTRHGHPVDGITRHGSGRPPVARCGGPNVCAACASDAARMRAANTHRFN